MSAESGISTFRDNGGLWEQYNVEDVATPEGWVRNPQLVTDFYNTRRRQLLSVKPCLGHELVAKLEEKHKVVVVTQNVDDLHEKAGSTNVIHLHGELMKACSSRDVDDERYHVLLTAEHPTIEEGQLAGDGSLLRPFIVFFGEAVPNLGIAAEACQQADMLVIIGTSLVVYPAAQLRHYAPQGIPVYIIDPKDVPVEHAPNIRHLKTGASQGMRQLTELL